MISDLRIRLNQAVTAGAHAGLLALLGESCGTTIEFRVVGSPIFLPLAALERMAEEGRQ